MESVELGTCKCGHYNQVVFIYRWSLQQVDCTSTCKGQICGLSYIPSQNVDCQNMIDYNKNMFNHVF